MNSNTEEKWSKEEIIVEIAFMQARIKRSKNHQEVQYRRQLIRNFRLMLTRMESDQEKLHNELALENEFLLRKQDSMKRRGVNKNTRMPKVRQQQDWKSLDYLTL